MLKKLGIGCLAIVLLTVVMVVGLMVIGSGAGGSGPASRAGAPRVTAGDEPSSGKPEAIRRDTGEIPGLMPVDVYGNFDGKRGFVLADRRSMPDGSMYWQCKEDGGGRYDRDVEVYSTAGSASTVRSVRATSAAYLTDPDDTARDFLGLIASLTYDGSRPAEARAWVEENIGKASSTNIGGVKFELFAGGTARILRITVSPHTEAESEVASE